MSAAAPIPLDTPLSGVVYGWNWAWPDSVYPYAISGDRIGVVTPGSENFTVAVYSTATGRQVGRTTTISMSGWPIWGGFYAAPDGNFYVAAGRSNSSESDNFTTAVVRKYNASWKLQGTAAIKGGWSHGSIKGIYSPFDAGAADMVLVGNRLVLHFPRLMYRAPDGLHHQGNFTVEVDTKSMSAVPFENLGDTVYSSHSFNQFVTTNGSDLVFVDHGDAYPRSIQMGVMRNYPAGRFADTYDLLTFAGSIGDNYTGARVTDIISGPQGVVVLGNTRPKPGSKSSFINVDHDAAHDGFSIAANPKTGAHTFRSLTSVPKSSDVRGPRAVQIGADRFAVIYAVDTNVNSDKRTSQLVYSVMDSGGRVLSTTRFGGIDFAPSVAPVRVGGAVYVGVTMRNSSGSEDSALMPIEIQNPGDSSMPVCPPGPFPDVPATNVHCANIAWLSTTGITQPVGGKYLPKSPVTRGSMATFLYRLVHPAKAIPRCTAKPFPDVPVDYVHCGAIQWAAKNGIAVGYGDRTYRPENPVTRGSMATFLYRIAGSPSTPKCTAKPFTDVAKSYLHCKTIRWAKTDGITSGLAGGATYGPEQVVHRDQMASFLHRIHDYLN